jgi:hypothetical protein
LASASAFAEIYRRTYPQLSPELTISATASGKTITWTMSPNYRLGVLDNKIVDSHWYGQSPDFDQFAPDKRQNLYQVVPAQIDSISLGNSASYSGLPTPPPLPTFAPIKSAKSLLRFLPDIRYSKINNSYVFGFRTDPEHLFGLQTKPFKIGKLYFKFPYLESFLNLDKYRFNDPKPIIPPNAIYKNSPYGIQNLQKELLVPKSFENSLYYKKI